jgi:hypothetical protein
MSGDLLGEASLSTQTSLFTPSLPRSQAFPIAQELLRKLMLSRSLHTSAQVLQELYVTLTRKGKSPISAESAPRYIDQIAAWPVALTDSNRSAAQSNYPSARCFPFGMR